MLCDDQLIVVSCEQHGVLVVLGSVGAVLRQGARRELLNKVRLFAVYRDARVILLSDHKRYV